MKRNMFFIAISFLIISLAGNSVFACYSYGNENHACYEFYRADAVFVGTVKAIDEKSKIDFTVEEAFAGVDNKEVTIIDNPICGYEAFKVGEKYLVYAKKNALFAKGYFYVHGNSKIIEFPKAKNDVLELRKFLQTDEASINGNVYTYNRGQLAGVKVSVAGNGVFFSTVTDEQGQFKVPGLAVGSYSVKADLPLNFRDDYGEKPKKEFSVELRRGECERVDFTGRIKNKLWF
jgi:hypothetical protein